jgi:hypothetical protein
VIGIIAAERIGEMRRIGLMAEPFRHVAFGLRHAA